MRPPCSILIAFLYEVLFLPSRFSTKNDIDAPKITFSPSLGDIHHEHEGAPLDSVLQANAQNQVQLHDLHVKIT